MDDPPDDTGRPPTNFLPSLLAPPSPASFVTVSDATTMSSKLNTTVSSQPPSLNDVPSLSSLQHSSLIIDSAPGIDGIVYSFLINASDQILSYYLDIVNSVVNTGNVPITCKIQTIFKNKGNPDGPAAYRPIALFSVLTKIAEHLVKNRLQWIAESSALLANSQFGLWKGRSTLDSLSIFTSDIRLSFFQGKSVTTSFLDVSSSYDNVQLLILRNKLKMPVRLSNYL
ncbi:Probable RNA-directed DNA polymerase from transposon X-element [Eumeta japonica]|uniref:Probable RNA-directed DNA polymerase from transposon X-element n=1 Tax=Eumeta variegata TaxID=151549 RepID=A0A4C1U8B0_EUMVA|nr:Probable RNA-directed DNA polymerase from transposon X-element [Eumeta japonica]